MLVASIVPRLAVTGRGGLSEDLLWEVGRMGCH